MDDAQDRAAWTVVFDGDCRLCQRWVSRWKRRTPKSVAYLPYQTPGLLEALKIPIEQAQAAVQLVNHATGRRTEGADAVFELLTLGGAGLWARALWNLPVSRLLARLGYRFIARHRSCHLG